MFDRSQDPIDLLDQASDWGTTVAEAKPKKGAKAFMWLLTAFVCLAFGAVLILPVIAGLVFFDSTGALFEVSVVGMMLVMAMAFKYQSNNQPRNALQIDYKACELRLGAEKKTGAFVREQVVGFRDIEEVYVNSSNPIDPALCIRIPGELVTLHFHRADQSGLDELANKIMAARESALRAPVRSRIQSKMHGFEASFREAKERIRTRIVTRTAT